ncbi:MAG: amidohydrolase, partial [Acidobacteriota bacterium]|nr:amidohydrolase [Acidobacteriota bacterium]
MIDRRRFLQTALAASALPKLSGQSTWGGQILDIHLHPRRGGDKEWDHVQGSGVTNAVLLPGVGSEERAKLVVKQHAANFVRFTNADVRQPDAVARLTA